LEGEEPTQNEIRYGNFQQVETPHETMQDNTLIPLTQQQTFPEFLEKVMTPDSADTDFDRLLGKDITVRNILRSDLLLLTEMTDIAFQCQKIGAKKFAAFLASIRNAKMDMTSSVDGFERKAQTTINLQKDISFGAQGFDKKKSIFSFRRQGQK